MSTPEKRLSSCTYCGLPVRSRIETTDLPVYCCSGCLFADSLSQSLRQERLSLWMIFAMVTVFLVFNQILLFLLGGKYLAEGSDSGAVLLSFSLLAGVVAWGSAAGMAIRQSKQGMTPLPWVFIGISLLFVCGAFYGSMYDAEHLQWTARAGLIGSVVVLCFCFLQRWLLRPFRKRSQ
jgi:ABC-type multidrug transport system permease subunit